MGWTPSLEPKRDSVRLSWRSTWVLEISEMSGWVKVWLPISWPSRKTRCMTPTLFLAGLADHEEGGLDVELLEDVEDARGPDGVGPIVER